MGLLKNILSIIGGVVIVGVLFAFVKFDLGTRMNQISKLDPGAMDAYAKMADTLLTTGNSAEAMVKMVQVEDDLSTEELVANLNEIAISKNFKVVGDAIMSKSGVDADGQKTKLVRILSFCSPSIAKQFINYSKAFGAFMPCRILIVEDDDGHRWMYTMSMELMLFGGHTLPADMLKQAKHVRDTMYLMVNQAGKVDGDF
jgi:uncharacterized protein (DUF302 family)